MVPTPAYGSPPQLQLEHCSNSVPLGMPPCVFTQLLVMTCDFPVSERETDAADKLVLLPFFSFSLLVFSLHSDQCRPFRTAQPHLSLPALVSNKRPHARVHLPEPASRTLPEHRHEKHLYSPLTPPSTFFPMTPLVSLQDQTVVGLLTSLRTSAGTYTFPVRRSLFCLCARSFFQECLLSVEPEWWRLWAFPIVRSCCQRAFPSPLLLSLPHASFRNSH